MGTFPLPTTVQDADDWRAVGEELTGLAAHCQADHTFILPRGLAHRGANPSGLGARPFEMRPHARIRNWAFEDLIVRVEAGATVAELNAQLASHRQWVPVGMPDEPDDTIGGLLATGLEGLWRGAYGRLADRVLAVSAWIPAFGVVHLGAPVVKNVAGYNLPRLFLGTDAVFGILLDVTLKLAPRPPMFATWESPVACANDAILVIEAMSGVGSWSFLGIRRDTDGWAVIACLAGSEARLQRRARVAGTPATVGATWAASGRFADGREWVTGAVARRHRKSVLDWLTRHDGYGWIEWESGGVWAQVSDDTVDELAARGADWDGALRPARGGRRRGFRPSPVAERLKTTLDPHQVLRPLAVEEAGCGRRA
jgi:FAD/FMN-containing dehydrogenase